MRPPCEVVVRYVLPAFRSMVAKELIEKYGFTQVAAAKRLGTTQAAISYYLDAKRGGKQMKRLEANSTIREVIAEISEGTAKGTMKTEEAMLRFCELCNTLRMQDVICTMHRDYVPLPASCRVCPRPMGD